MKKLDLAYEIISESKRTRALYLESGRDYHKVVANMYSIFECYANGLIGWNTVRSYWQKSIMEYLDLYKDRQDLYVMENNRMLKEYESTLQRFKPALDEYKKVSESKMTSNIVIKNQISESVAKEQSNLYFNKRTLSEKAIKDISNINDWNKVIEAYPNLTNNDKAKLRMLTVFENDTFNVTGWSKLNEGPTLDTTQMITTVMSEAPLSTSPRPVARPGRDLPGGGYQWPNGAIEEPGGYNPMSMSPKRNLAPTTSPRPKPRPQSNVGRSEMSPTPGVWDGSTRGFESVQKEGYKILPSIDKERYQERRGLEGPFMTLSGKVVYYDPKEGSYYDPDTDMYLSYDEFKALDNDRTGMKENEEPVKFNGKKFTSYKRFNSEAKANAFLEKNEAYGVIGEKDGYVYVAKNADLGEAAAKIAVKEEASNTNAKRVSWGPAAKKYTIQQVGDAIVKNAERYSGINQVLVKKLGQALLNYTDTNLEVLTPKEIQRIAKFLSINAKAAENLITGGISRLGSVEEMTSPRLMEVELDETNYNKPKSFMKKIIKKNQPTKTETSERFAIINDENEIEVYSQESDRLIRKVKMPDKESAIRRLKRALYEPDLGTFRGKQMWFSNKEPGLRFSEVDKELEEVSNCIPNEVTEALTLDYSRYMRSHGKKPRDPGHSSLWMFTTREYGMPDDDEIFQFQGSFADAKKAAAKWAKSQDAYRVYVME